MKNLSIVIFAKLLLLFSVHFLYAQESTMNVKVHFKDGKVITGDVFIYDTSPETFDLVTDVQETYRISEIEYFEGSGILVRRFTYRGKDKLFTAIVEGKKMSLYKTEKIEEITFYVYKDGKMYKLEGGKMEIEKDGSRYVKENTRYKGTLKVLLSPDSALMSKVDKVKYKEKELSELVILYNEGKVSYVNYNSVASRRKKAAFFYLQYTNETDYTIYSDLNTTPYFWELGTKIKYDQNSRHSVKVGLEYGKITGELYEQDNYYHTSLAFTYLYDFFRLPNVNVYVSLRMMDISYDRGIYNNRFYLFPRLSPGIGLEFYSHEKIRAYLELNHLAILRRIPYNFSVGLAYQF